MTNLIVLNGNLASRPEFIYKDGALIGAKYRLAVQRSYKKDGEPDTDFFNCIAFSEKKAQFLKDNFDMDPKGQHIKACVTGWVKTGTYENKDGVTVPSFEIQVDTQDFQKTLPYGNGNGTTATTDADGFMNVSQEELDALPFN